MDHSSVFRTAARAGDVDGVVAAATDDAAAPDVAGAVTAAPDAVTTEPGVVTAAVDVVTAWADAANASGMSFKTGNSRVSPLTGNSA